MTTDETHVHRSFVGMRFQQALVLPLILALVLGGCRKDADNERPGIKIISPSENASLIIPDTLLVTVEARDDAGLERVSVTLLDQNNVPVVAGSSAAASGKVATVTLALPVTDEQITSGVYKLFATASDGELTGKDWINLHVSAAPLRLRAVFTVTEPAPGSTALYRTDSTGQTAVAQTWPIDLAGADISSAAQRLFIAGGVSGDLLALSPDGLGTVWSRPNLSSTGIPWFTSVDVCGDGRVYVGHADGSIRGFLAGNGTGGTGGTLPEMFRTLQCITMGDLLLATERHFVTGEHRLGIYYWQSGTLASTQALDAEPVALFPRDAGHALIFGNRNGQGRVLDRTLAGSGTWEAYTWPSPITAVVRLSDLNWLVALANGDLQRFTYNNIGSIPIGTTPVLTAMAFDPVSGRVYGGSDGQVILIDPVNGTTSPGWTVDGSVRKVLPLLNR